MVKAKSFNYKDYLGNNEKICRFYKVCDGKKKFHCKHYIMKLDCDEYIRLRDEIRGIKMAKLNKDDIENPYEDWQKNKKKGRKKRVK